MWSIGIDYSMTCPAACAYDAGEVKFWFAHTSKDITLGALHGVRVDTAQAMTPRAINVAAECVKWITRFPAVRIVHLEDYAFNATGRVFHIGEHTGALKVALYHERIAVEPVPPTVIKKFATGKGNADKERMTAAFLDAYPTAKTWILPLFPRATKTTIVAKSPLADLADAYWIARYAFEKP